MEGQTIMMHDVSDNSVVCRCSFLRFISFIATNRLLLACTNRLRLLPCRRQDPLCEENEGVFKIFLATPLSRLYLRRVIKIYIHFSKL